MKLIVLFIVGLVANINFAYADICGRNYIVKSEIARQLNKSCNDITLSDLASIKKLSINPEYYFNAVPDYYDYNYDYRYPLQRSDFSGLSGLEELEVWIAGNWVEKYNETQSWDVFAEIPQIRKLVYHTSFSPKLIEPLNRLEALELYATAFWAKEWGQYWARTRNMANGREIAAKTTLKHLLVKSLNSERPFFFLNVDVLPFNQCNQLEELTLDGAISENIDILGEAGKIGRCHGTSQPTLKKLHLNLFSQDSSILTDSSFGPDSPISDLAINFSWSQTATLIAKLTQLKSFIYLGDDYCGKSDLEITHPTIQKVSFGNRRLSCSVGGLVTLRDMPNLMEADLLGYMGNEVALINLPLLPSSSLKVVAQRYYFEELPWNGTLSLNKSFTDHLPYSMDRLPKFKQMDGITHLDLRFNAINDISVDYAAYLPANLEELNLCDNPLKNPDAIWNLIKGYPTDAHFKILVSTNKGCESLN